MSTSYIRVPPDSTGKKIRHFERLDVKVSTVLIDFKTIGKGSLVVGSISGFVGKFVGFSSEYDNLFVFVTDANGLFVTGELLTIDSVNVATVVSVVDYHTPVVNITDADNPYYKQKIDKHGSSIVKFNEGNPSMDAFGNLQTSSIQRIDDHTFIYGNNNHKYYDEISGGTIATNLTQSALVLSIDSTNGSRVCRTSNQYYPYTPGQGIEVMSSIMIGDQGKANVVRRWGLFDDYNGVFFQVSGTTFQVCIRNNSTGVITNEIVSQNNFNGEGLDDINTGDYLLNLSKYNLYWIDYQWLGVGKVRFGTFSPEGDKITVHTFTNPNSKTVPYMNSGTLPLRLEQFNIDTTSSSSEMKLVCCAIIKQGADATLSGSKYDVYIESRNISGSSANYPFISSKPPLTINGKINRMTFIPTNIDIFVEGDSCRIDFLINPTLVGATFTGNTNVLSSAALIDIDATSLTGGFRTSTIMLSPGMNRIEYPDTLENALKLNADGVTQDTFTFSISTNKSNGSAIVYGTTRWKEIH